MGFVKLGTHSGTNYGILSARNLLSFNSQYTTDRNLYKIMGCEADRNLFNFQDVNQEFIPVMGFFTIRHLFKIPDLSVWKLSWFVLWDLLLTIVLQHQLRRICQVHDFTQSQRLGSAREGCRSINFKAEDQTDVIILKLLKSTSCLMTPVRTNSAL